MIILFDLDGTLIDSTEAILESFHNSFDVHEVEHPSDAAIKALIGHPLDVMYRELGINEEMVWEYVNTYKEHYRVISTQKTELLENAHEAITLASEMAQIGIVTTKTGKYSQVLMEHFEIMDRFEVLIGREHVQNPKPDAEPILKALESFNTEGEEIWMVGDTEMDLLSAKNAGVKSLGVLCGYGTKKSLNKYTELVFQDTLEAMKYLKSRK